MVLWQQIVTIANSLIGWAVKHVDTVDPLQNLYYQVLTAPQCRQ